MTLQGLRRTPKHAHDSKSIPWVRFPVILEINTWVWIEELRKKYGEKTDLACVPAAEWDVLARGDFNAVWLMGVWERSPAGIAVANSNEGLNEEFRLTLANFQITDNVGSPYCVKRYRVDQHLGGPAALAVARQELARRGMKLLLDFVPNHVAPDHPWVREHPEYFVPGTRDELRESPAGYIEVDGKVIARGKDPFFPAWPDVVQLNAFDTGLRSAVIKEVENIARQCDGVRCDMAMLVVNDVFARTWNGHVQETPGTEFWDDIIHPIKASHPEFIFIAEAYWGLEWRLQQNGFDFCYDKTLYDRLVSGKAEEVRQHLMAEKVYQEKLIRFIENHDEPRAAAAFSPERGRIAAMASFTVPGARLLHQGQLEGRKIKLPVFLCRAPQEGKDDLLMAFYSKLLSTIAKPIFHEGHWELCEVSGWPDNQRFKNLVAWTWNKDQETVLIVLNLSDVCSDGRVRLPIQWLAGKDWQLFDEFSGVTYERSRDEMVRDGLYVKLQPWGFHCFSCSAAATSHAPREERVL